MAYDESFEPEPEAPTSAPADTAPLAPEAAAPEATEPTEITPEAATETEAPEAPEVAGDGAELPTEEEGDGEEGAQGTPPEVVAFDEPAYLKTHFGEKAPATAAELKQRLEALEAKQLTPEHEAQLAMLRDPAKLAEYAKLATTDYDKVDAIEAMRENFALQHPDLGEAARERRFQKQFAEKYPILAAALIRPDDYEADDPALLADREDADYDAKADRAALAAAQQERTKQFIASQAAAPGPQLSTEQQADIAALPGWLDEAYRDGATIPVDAGEGFKFNLPIPNAADFKAAFNDTFSLIDKLTLTKPLAEGGVLNRANHALVTAFLQNPQAFVQHIAKQARAATAEPEAAIPLATITNSSTAKRAPAKTAATPAAAAGERNHPAYVDPDAWQNSNV